MYFGAASTFTIEYNRHTFPKVLATVFHYSTYSSTDG